MTASASAILASPIPETTATSIFKQSESCRFNMLSDAPYMSDTPATAPSEAKYWELTGLATAGQPGFRQFPPRSNNSRLTRPRHRERLRQLIRYLYYRATSLKSVQIGSASPEGADSYFPSPLVNAVDTDAAIHAPRQHPGARDYLYL